LHQTVVSEVKKRQIFVFDLVIDLGFVLREFIDVCLQEKRFEGSSASM
jgi:hypothetical protein